jgi:hypothetical protein
MIKPAHDEAPHWISCTHAHPIADRLNYARVSELSIVQQNILQGATLMDPRHNSTQPGSEGLATIKAAITKLDIKTGRLSLWFFIPAVATGIGSATLLAGGFASTLLTGLI